MSKREPHSNATSKRVRRKSVGDADGNIYST
jgi:hypothetical protein